MKMFTGTRTDAQDFYLENGWSNGNEKPDIEGILFSDGSVAIRWLTRYHSTVVYNSFGDFENTYGSQAKPGLRIDWK